MWKILQFPVTRVVLAFLSLMIVVGIAQSVFDLLPQKDSIPMVLLSAAAVALVACVGYYAFVRIIEKRPVTELSSSGAAAELTIGILVGGALFTVTIGILWALGYYQVDGINTWTVMIPVLASAVAAGVAEEILFRGALFRIIEESLGTWLALAITALFFGLSHLANPNATLIAAIAIALEAGILLCAAYIFTRRLWLAIGIHFAWNFTQGGIFGVAISGNQTQGLFQSTLSGPTLLSGGEFGAEASVFAVLVCLVAGIYFIRRGLQKGNIVKPFWIR